MLAPPPPQLIFGSAVDLARDIRAGAVSAHEVTEAHIRRIEAVDPQLNAVVIRLFERALEQASAADDARRQGRPLGPLHGVPITLKEQFRVEGTDSTFGLHRFVGNRAESEGALVRRLRGAGAIILGKTNLPPTLVGFESDNPVYGRTKNPWNLDRSPGGSSGGEAAILAAGGSVLGLGGDFGGSVRIPAHACGIHGFKPTGRRLTNEDTFPGILGGGQEAIVAQPGPMARHVADLRLMMTVLAAPGLETAADLPAPVLWPEGDVDLRGLRVGYYTDDGYFPASPAARRAVEEAARFLERRGAVVEQFAPPGVAEAIDLFLGITSADGAAWLKQALGRERPPAVLQGLLKGASLPNWLHPTVAAMLERRGQRYLGSIIRAMETRSAAGYFEVVDRLNRYRRRFLDHVEQSQLDVIVCPPYPLPALRHGSGEHLFPALSYPLLYSLLGMPAGVVAATRVRAGEEGDRKVSPDLTERSAREVDEGSVGLPIGVQVVSRHWRDDVALSVMEALEADFRGTPDYPFKPELAG